MKRWIIILAGIVIAWVAAFAFLHWRQMPKPVDTDYKPNPIPLSESSRRILDTSEEFVLLSLQPDPGRLTTNTAEMFHDFPVLGRAEIRDRTRRAELLRALYKGIVDSDGAMAICFNPRHGIRAVTGTNWIELVICFQCYRMREYGTGQGDGATTTKSPNEVFNRALKSAGLPLTAD